MSRNIAQFKEKRKELKRLIKGFRKGDAPHIDREGDYAPKIAVVSDVSHIDK
jgi:hypothetical protein